MMRIDQGRSGYVGVGMIGALQVKRIGNTKMKLST